MTTRKKAIWAFVGISISATVLLLRTWGEAVAQRPPHVAGQGARFAVSTQTVTVDRIDHVFVRIYDEQAHTMCYGFINQNISCVRVAEVIP